MQYEDYDGSAKYYVHGTTNLNALHVKSLRRIAQAAGIGTGGWRSVASKNELIDYITRHFDGKPFEQPKPEVTPDINPMPETPKPTPPGGDILTAALGEIIKRHIESGLSEETLTKIVKRELENHSKKVIIKIADVPEFDAGTQHKVFEDVVQFLANRESIILTGPAGSGKTTCLSVAAKVLNLDYSSTSVGQQTSRTDIMGYMNANGQYVESEFYKRYKNGGLYNMDEIDAGNSNCLTVINSALSNGECAFPCGMVEKHKDFVAAATANTYCNGSSRIYVGRNPIDGATLDRFSFIDFEYDEAFERQLAGNDEWVDYVLKVRKAVQDLEIRHIVSPRASIKGAKMLKVMNRNKVEKYILWKGLDKTSIQKIKSHMGG